jgi:hypothetical protein
MMKSLLGVADSEAQAVSTFNQILAAGFADNDISVLFPDMDRPEGATAGDGS